MSAIEIRVPGESPRARFVLDTFFTTIGYPFRIVEEWQDATLRIAYGTAADGTEELRLPSYDPPENLAVGHVDGMAVLHGGSPPVTCWSDGVAQFDLVGIPYRFLSREEEIGHPTGEFRAYHSELYNHGLTQSPIFDWYIASLERQLDARLPDLEKEPRWPNGATFAVALTHDVDVVNTSGLGPAARQLRTAVASESRRRERFRALLLGAEQLKRFITSSGADDPAWNFERWLEVEREHDLRSTFYFAVPGAGDRSARDPAYTLEDTIRFRGERTTVGGLMERLADGGWEVGLHGSLQSATDRDALLREKCRLDGVVDDADGVRQHHLRFSYPETWRAQWACGFEYDSTLGFNDRLGYRAGIGVPFRPYDARAEEPIDLVVVPTSVQDNTLFFFEYAGRDRAMDRCRSRIRETAATGGLLTLLWHPYTVSHPNWPEPMEMYGNLLSELADYDAYIGTARDVARWWRERSARVRCYPSRP